MNKNLDIPWDLLSKSQLGWTLAILFNKIIYISLGKLLRYFHYISVFHWNNRNNPNIAPGKSDSILEVIVLRFIKGVIGRESERESGRESERFFFLNFRFWSALTSYKCAWKKIPKYQLLVNWIGGAAVTHSTWSPGIETNCWLFCPWQLAN